MSKFQNVFAEASRHAAADLPIVWTTYPAYRARLADWNTTAGVRNGFTRSVTGEGKLPFSADLVPLANHALVRERGEGVIYYVLAQHLYRFCNFTERLELEAVIPACVHLRFAEAPFGVPDVLARDAGRVVIDESWHAECAVDLREKIQSSIGIAPCRPRSPAFLYVLRMVKASLPERYHRLVDIVFACVSETLITASLSYVPRDAAVIPQIREVLGEHAREEGFHHAIFGQTIGVMWQQLSAEDRQIAGPLFAVFIAAFLRPDVASELDALEAAGFSAGDAKRIVEDTHGASAQRSGMWRAAAPTVRFMRHYELLNHAATQDMLATLDLMPPSEEIDAQQHSVN